MKNQVFHDFGFSLPAGLLKMVEELNNAIKIDASYIDCIQDEIRSLAHGYTDAGLTEEQAEQVIDYYCRRRWT